jgi:hypothetical protein
MSPKRVGPNDIEQPVERDGRHESTTTSHPAFAQISASRVSSSPGAVLYGSGFKHTHFIVVTIKRSELSRNLNDDSYFAGEELINVWVSEAQWATFLSTLNSGGGTPCTLHWFNGDYVPGIPMRQQRDVAQKEGDETMADLLVQIDNAIAEVEGDIGRDLSKAKRDRILKPMQAVRSALGATLPWIQKQFAEQMEETVEHGKIEIEAYIQSAIHRAGAQALAAAGDIPLQLPMTTAEDKSDG